MNKVKFKKLFFIILCITTICIGLNVYSYDKPSDFESYTKGDDSKFEEMVDLGNSALGAIQIVGVLASVIILMIIGIKYLTGSAEEKAGYKKSLLPYVVGAIILFAAPTIVNIVYKFSEGF